MKLANDLIDEVVRRKLSGTKPRAIHLTPRSWDQVVAEVGDVEGLIRSNGETRSFLGTPVLLDDAAVGVVVE
jgi:hypothetical protein